MSITRPRVIKLQIGRSFSIIYEHEYPEFASHSFFVVLGSYSKPWTSSGTKTVSNVDAVTVDWEKWVPLYIRKLTLFCVKETTSGKLYVFFTYILIIGAIP